MEKLNRHNYESYYLDFLEGRLSVSEQEAFRAFLNKHPDLQIDALPTLPQEADTLSEGLKLALKQDLEIPTPTPANAEWFLVAEKEGWLDTTAARNWADFLKNHPEWEKDRYWMQQTTLMADPELTMPDKAQLKQKARIIPWSAIATGAAIAASFILVFLVWQPSNNTFNPPAMGTAQQNWSPNSPANQIPKNVSAQHSSGQNTSEVPQTNLSSSPSPITPHNNNGDPTIGRLALRDAGPVSVQSNRKGFNVRPQNLSNPRHRMDEMVDGDFAGSLTLVEPAAPVTQALSQLIKNEVLFKKSDADSKSRKGFLIKIGEFEIYANRTIKTKDE